MKKILFLIFSLLAIIPAMASDGTKFTVFGQVTDTDGTPINGVTVELSVSGSSMSTVTANVTLINGNNAGGYYVMELANMPSDPNDTPIYVNEGTSMTITATITGKSASWTGLRAASEPQEVNLRLSTGSGGGSGSSGGGSGGGGGGTSGEEFSNIISKEYREELIAKDLPAKFNFTTPILPVYEIVIIGNINAGLINTRIELLKNRSSLVNIHAPETLYKYLNIWVGTSGFATPKNVKEATIEFKVDNSWLESMNFKDADVVMFRWDGKEWLPLETHMKRKDTNFTYFDAKTNAFSPFAISAIRGEIPVTTPITQMIPATATSTEAPAASPGLPPTSSIKILIILLIIILLVVAVYIYYKTIRKK